MQKLFVKCGRRWELLSSYSCYKFLLWVAFDCKDFKHDSERDTLKRTLVTPVPSKFTYKRMSPLFNLISVFK